MKVKTEGFQNLSEGLERFIMVVEKNPRKVPTWIGKLECSPV